MHDFQSFENMVALILLLCAYQFIAALEGLLKIKSVDS